MNLIDDLREVFTYDPATGIITRIKARRKCDLGPAGCVAERGYVQIKYKNAKIYAHHLAWALHYGHWPEPGVDHENLDKGDNRLANLRLATQTQNAGNMGLTKANTTGFKGVEQMPSGKWRAGIRSGGTRVWFGPFDTAEEAARRYDLAARQEFGSFARTNFPAPTNDGPLVDRIKVETVEKKSTGEEKVEGKQES